MLARYSLTYRYRVAPVTALSRHRSRGVFVGPWKASATGVHQRRGLRIVMSVFDAFAMLGCSSHAGGRLPLIAGPSRSHLDSDKDNGVKDDGIKQDRSLSRITTAADG